MSRFRPSPARRPAPAPSRRHRHRGFTLVSVLVALAVSAFGILAVVRLVANATTASTQNQATMLLAPLGNAFWGVMQANPTLITNGSLAGTYTTSNITSAPAPLRPWLTDALVGDTGTLQTRQPLPNGSSITISTGNEANGAACALATGCTVTVVFSWAQTATAGRAATARTQTLYFQFPG